MNSTLRILHVIESLNPATGGPPAIAVSLANAQSQLGHQVTIAAHDSNEFELYKYYSVSNNIKRITVARPTIFETLTGKGPVTAKLTNIVASYDIVHLHAVWGPVLLLTSLACRLQNKLYVILLNGMLHPWCLNQSKWKKRLALALGYKAMLNNAACLHLGNQAEAELIRPLKLQAKTRIIPNAAPDSAFNYSSDSNHFRKQYLADSKCRYILFLSRIHYKKGIDLLVRAFHALPAEHDPIRLVIAGPDDGYLAQVIRLIHSLQLEDRVIYTGPLYGEIKWQALAGADLFCLPSRQEGFSVAILEAMAMGVPVVISDECHFPEVASHRCGVICSLSLTSIVDSLHAILSSDTYAKHLGESARSYTFAHHRWPVVAEQTVSLYHELLTSSTESSRSA